MKPPDDQIDLFRQLQLLTAKPVLFVCNVEEECVASGNNFSESVKVWAQNQGAKIINISAKIESDPTDLGEFVPPAPIVTGKFVEAVTGILSYNIKPPAPPPPPPWP